MDDWSASTQADRQVAALILSMGGVWYCSSYTILPRCQCGGFRKDSAVACMSLVVGFAGTRRHRFPENGFTAKVTAAAAKQHQSARINAVEQRTCKCWGEEECSARAEGAHRNESQGGPQFPSLSDINSANSTQSRRRDPKAVEARSFGEGPMGDLACTRITGMQVPIAMLAR